MGGSMIHHINRPNKKKTEDPIRCKGRQKKERKKETSIYDKL